MQKDRTLYVKYLEEVASCANHIKETLLHEDMELYDSEADRSAEFEAIKHQLLATMQMLIPYLKD